MSHSLSQSGSTLSLNVKTVHWDESENMYPLDFLVEQIRLASHSSERLQLRMKFVRGSHLLVNLANFLMLYSSTTGWTVTISFSLTHVHVTTLTQ